MSHQEYDNTMSITMGLLLIFTFFTLFWFMEIADMAPQVVMEKCEEELPRNQHCKWIAVPKEEDNNVQIN